MAEEAEISQSQHDDQEAVLYQQQQSYQTKSQSSQYSANNKRGRGGIGQYTYNRFNNNNNR